MFIDILKIKHRVMRNHCSSRPNLTTEVPIDNIFRYQYLNKQARQSIPSHMNQNVGTHQFKVFPPYQHTDCDNQ